jgi:hypothetical protein
MLKFSRCVFGRSWAAATSCLGLSLGLVLAATGACRKPWPDASGASKSLDTARVASKEPRFQCSDRMVPQEFLAFAEERGVDRVKASELFQKMLEVKGLTDPVTGFATAIEQVPSIAVGLEAAKSGAGAFYVEADVHNLGGLNAALTYEEANTVYRFYARTLHDNLDAILHTGGVEDGQLCAIRHGGDEFSFVLMARTGLTKEAIVSAIEKSRADISTYVERYPCSLTAGSNTMRVASPR